MVVHFGFLDTLDKNHWVETFHLEVAVVAIHAIHQPFLAHGILVVEIDRELEIDRVLETGRVLETDRALETDRELEIDKALETDKVVEIEKTLEHDPISHWEAQVVVLDLRKKVSKHLKKIQENKCFTKHKFILIFF